MQKNGIIPQMIARDVRRQYLKSLLQIESNSMFKISSPAVFSSIFLPLGSYLWVWIWNMYFMSCNNQVKNKQAEKEIISIHQNIVVVK